MLASPFDTNPNKTSRIPVPDDVDIVFEKATALGIKTDTTPCDAEWGERYFHVTDPDGHEISFAKPLKGSG